MLVTYTLFIDAVSTSEVLVAFCISDCTAEKMVERVAGNVEERCVNSLQQCRSVYFL
jgi:hypothetical protein